MANAEVAPNCFPCRIDGYLARFKGKMLQTLCTERLPWHLPCRQTCAGAGFLFMANVPAAYYWIISYEQYEQKEKSWGFVNAVTQRFSILPHLIFVWAAAKELFRRRKKLQLCSSIYTHILLRIRSTMRKDFKEVLTACALSSVM